MSVGVALAVGCAVLAACAYGLASVLQAIGVARAAARGSASGSVGGSASPSASASASPSASPSALSGLAHQAPYVVGLLLDLVGFAASVIALHRLPLFFVQSAVAGSVGVTAVLAGVWLDAVLRAREIVAVAALSAGLVLLAVSARPEPPTSLPLVGRWVLLAGVGALAVTLLFAVWRRRPAALALVSGLGFSGTGIGARVWHVPHPLAGLATDPVVWAVVGYGVVGAVAFAAALEHGRVTVVAAVTFVVETCLPTAIGVAVLGDRPRAGYAVVAGAGFALAIVASLVLARYAEP